MTRSSRSSSRSSSGSRGGSSSCTRSSSCRSSSSDSRSSRHLIRIKKIKKKLKKLKKLTGQGSRHNRHSCRSRNAVSKERSKRIKSRHPGRRNVRGKHRHNSRERSHRREKNDSRDYERHGSFKRKRNIDDNLKLHDRKRKYKHVQSNSSGCCCKTSHADSRHDDSVLETKHEVEDSTRNYDKHHHNCHHADSYLDAKTSERRKLCVPTDGIVEAELDIKNSKLGGQERDWLVLSLNVAKAPKPRVQDCSCDDFKLSLPVCSMSAMSKVTQDIDLNIAVNEAGDAIGNSIPLQLPIPSCCSLLEGPALCHQSQSHVGEHPQHEVIDSTFCSKAVKNGDLIKQSAKESSHVTVSCQVESEIIILDDTEDEYTKNEESKMREMGNVLEDQWLQLKDAGTDLNLIDGVAKSLDNRVHGSGDEGKLSNGEKTIGNAQSTATQNEDVDLPFLLGDSAIEIVGQNVLRPTKNRVTNFNGFKARKKRMVHRTDLNLIDGVEKSLNNRVYGNGDEGKSSKGEKSIGNVQSTTTQTGDVDLPFLLGNSAIERVGQNVLCPAENRETNFNGFKARKKRMVHRTTPHLQDSMGDHFDITGSKLIVQKAFLNKQVTAGPHMWDANILCDLCHKGPSLFLGEWYAWCCGERLFKCSCSPESQMKLKSGLRTKKGNKVKKNEEAPRSGTVHKLCALWSSEVFEEQGGRLEGLWDAVRRGKSLTCTGCREFGATLGCRVKTCRRSFHYPCAERAASELRCRMWDGVQFPIACHSHRHVAQSCQNAKEKAPDLKNWRKRDWIHRTKPNLTVESFCATGQSNMASQLSYKRGESTQENACKSGVEIVISILSDGEDETFKAKENPGSYVKCNPDRITFDKRAHGKELIVGDSIGTIFKGGNQGLDDSRHEGVTCQLYYMGIRLLCSDISGGYEAVAIPCTNDVDEDSAPDINYITENRYLPSAKAILDSVLLDGRNVSKSCGGCNNVDIDNPLEEVSVHVDLKSGRRDGDIRIDWQGQPMFGRLPYDQYGRLQLGPETNDVIECNSQCPCGLECKNRELQKGLKIPLEVFKTKDRGWGVRTMQQIPRGKFVVEYVGEILTHREAREHRVIDNKSNLSCLFSMDHPGMSPEDQLMFDGFGISNVARFINHSCEGNLRIYRVYIESMDLRFYRIGLYAARDIEIGEELSYDYNYFNCRGMDKTELLIDPAAIKCLCGTRSCKLKLWTGAA